jgi:hypothetical protein
VAMTLDYLTTQSEGQFFERKECAGLCRRKGSSVPLGTVYWKTILLFRGSGASNAFLDFSTGPIGLWGNERVG